MHDDTTMNIIGGDGFSIYYDPHFTEDGYLTGFENNFSSDDYLIAMVPEPSSILLLDLIKDWLSDTVERNLSKIGIRTRSKSLLSKMCLFFHIGQGCAAPGERP